MQNIPLAMALPGMVLAREVLHPERPDGPVLFGKGATISGTAIERLAKMGVTAITVEGNPLPKEQGESLQDQLDGLDRRFRGHERDPVMMTIRQVMARQLRRSWGEGHE